MIISEGGGDKVDRTGTEVDFCDYTLHCRLDFEALKIAYIFIRTKFNLKRQALNTENK